MYLGSFALALTLVPALAWAQLSLNTVTVTSSSNVTALPDQAVFSVSVNSDIDKSLDDILKALDGSGITAEDLTGISSPQFSSGSATAIQRGFGTPPMLWAFYVPVPLPNIQTEKTHGRTYDDRRRRHSADCLSCRNYQRQFHKARLYFRDRADVYRSYCQCLSFPRRLGKAKIEIKPDIFHLKIS